MIVKFGGLLSEFNERQVDGFPISGYSVAEVLRGLAHSITTFDQTIYKLLIDGYSLLIKVNEQPLNEPLDRIGVFDHTIENKLTISTAIQVEGEETLGIVAKVGLIGLAFTGVGFLGISVTTFGLLGASLVASSIFKSPKVDTKEKNDKRSVNFSGVVNVIGSGTPLPLVFGQVWTGSIVASAYISTDRRSVN